MRSILRVRLLIAILALVIGGVVAVGAYHGQAASGGSVVLLSTDQTITGTSTGVTTSAKFPDGNSTAQCFIQVSTKSGAQTGTYGNCTGISVNVTCASGQFTMTPPDAGGAVTINGTASWVGAYDNGTTCTTAPKIGGVNPTLTADVSGLAAGQNVVAFWNSDEGVGFGNKAGRNGCVQFNDSAGNSSEQCIQMGTTAGPDGAFYEVKAGATSGTFVQSEGSQITNNGNMTLGGVFVEAVGQAGGTPPTAVPTSTPAPTPTSVPITNVTVPSATSQLGTDDTITGSSTGVTSSQKFPDGATTASCFVQINSKSGVQSNTTGSCSGYTVTVTCSSFQFSSTPPADQHGAAVVLAGTRQLVGAYDTGPSCTSPANATLTYTVSGIAAGTRVVFFWNNDSSASRGGCVAYTDTSGNSYPACVQNSATGNNGTYYEVIAGAATGTAFQMKGATGLGASGNLTAGGVFINVTGGRPLSASLVTVHRIQGLNHIRWFSAAHVRGFNVFNGHTKLNHHLVTSATGWYTFSTRRRVNHLRLLAVQ
jgi:hypothetical protein